MVFMTSYTYYKESEEQFWRASPVVIEVFTSTNSDTAVTEKESDSDGRLSKSLHADSALSRDASLYCVQVNRPFSLKPVSLRTGLVSINQVSGQ